jgi:LacI family transcriptional regulator
VPANARPHVRAQAPLGLRIDPQASLPVYAQLRQQLTWLMASGKLEPGTRLPTIRELGRQLKINLHTVRQAYHVLEEDGLLETKPGRGTRVLPIVLRQLISHSTRLPSHTVGVLLPTMTPFYSNFLQGLEEAAKRLDYLLIVCFALGGLQDARKLAQQLVSQNVDGLIAVATSGEVFPGLLPGFPVVCVDSPAVRTNSILLNLSGAGYHAARHLIWHGHKKIGLITASLEYDNSREAARGYRRALREKGLPLEQKWIIEVPAYLREFGYEAGQRLAQMAKPPTAVFASGDILALGAMQALREAGWRIPKDIAIVSKDNIEFAALSEPPLTSVSFPIYEAGSESMNMLHGIITDGAVRKKQLLPEARLVVRRSCGCDGASV